MNLLATNTGAQPSKKTVDNFLRDFAELFVRWPLPESVCADLCATRQSAGRVGTNLLSFLEARRLAEEVVLPSVSSALRDVERLDWLEKKNGRIQFEAEEEGSIPFAVVYLPTIENGKDAWHVAARGLTFRDTIDNAIAVTEPGYQT